MNSGSHKVTKIKNAILNIVIISMISFTVATISIGGWWLISNVSVWWAWVASFVVGSTLFAFWKWISMRLGKTEALKSEFITIAAHRIRTPMTRIKWMISEIATETGLGDNNPRILLLGEIVDNLIKASNNLLNAAEAGKTSLYDDYLFEVGRFEIMARQIIAEYSVGATQKDINVSVDIEENIPQISFDKERMRIAIGVFIENAILYTPKGGTIEVRIFLQETNIIFSIKDSGIGISKEALPYIGSKFFRTKDAVSVDRDRAGLGLFIAKEIIKKHNGRVNIDSKGKDGGSHFVVTIPLN